MSKLSLKKLLKEAEATTMVPPAPPAAPQSQRQGPTAQQQMMARRQTMDQHRPQLAQAQDLTNTISDVADKLRSSLGASKTVQATQEVAQLQSVLQQLQQSLAQIPQLESRQLKEDHGNAQEKFVERVLDSVNQKLFQSTVAIKGGNYQGALKQMSLSVQQLKKGIEILNQHAQSVEDDDDVFFPVD